MAKASANLFPYVHLVPAAAPASPAAGSQRLYLDSGDGNKLKRVDSGGTVTTVEGGGGSAAFIGAAAVRTTTQSIPTATYTAVILNGTEEYDTSSIHDPSTNASRFTIPSGLGGKWRFAANIEFAGSTSGQRVVGWSKNGTMLGNRYIDCRPSLTTAAYGPVISTSCDLLLAATDYIEASVFQDSGGALNVVSARVTCQYLG